VNYGSSDEELRDRIEFDAADDETLGYKKGGLVRGSVRGGGVALRGLGKGKVY
jgi:hypothetical protein